MLRLSPGLLAALLLPAPAMLRAQNVSTVREAEFRSRWANYHADQPRVERPPGSPDDAEPEAEHGVLPTLRSWFRNGPLVLRGSVTAGWEYSNRDFRAAVQPRESSTSSFFVAPSALVSYEREMGAWGVSFRYSAGYLRYLDGSYAGTASGTGSGSLSQTAGLDISRRGSRLALRAGVSASSGTGYDIERDRETDRTAFAGIFSADYSVTEFIRTGATLTGGHEIYANGTGASDDTRDHWSGTMFGEFVLTGKTTLNLEFGAGHESIENAGITTQERNYSQGVIRFHYQPTAKLTLTPSIGFGLLDESPSRANSRDGFRMLYSLAIAYAPTEKTSVRLFGGIEGGATEPEFSLALYWHPREATVFSLSAYQQSGLSTISFAHDRTRRGVLGSLQQRFFQRFELGLSGGWEKEDSTDDTQRLPGDDEPYYFYAANLSWEINQWLSWQAQMWTSSRRDRASTGSDRSQTRVSTSFRLTF